MNKNFVPLKEITMEDLNINELLKVELTPDEKEKIKQDTLKKINERREREYIRLFDEETKSISREEHKEMVKYAYDSLKYFNYNHYEFRGDLVIISSYDSNDEKIIELYREEWHNFMKAFIKKQEETYGW